MTRSAAALFAALAAVAVAWPAGAQALTSCPIGLDVADGRGQTGIIVSASHTLCIVRYPDGSILGWTAANLRPAGAPKATVPPSGGRPSEASGGPRLITPPAPGAPAGKSGPGVTVLRAPPSPDVLTLHADRSGHFWVTAEVDGTPIHFLVDTGANVVALNLADAQAIGFQPRDLAFDRIVETANGRVPAAVVRLREIRIDGLTVRNVTAAVVRTSRVSALGMNFLNRLKRFSVQGRTMTLER